MARLPYRKAGELPPEVAALLAEIEGERGYVPNIYRALANSETLARPILECVRAMRGPMALPAHLRETAVLAVAAATQCAYMRAAHEPLALAAGLSPDEVRALGAGVSDSLPDASEAVVAYVEAVTRGVRAPDAVWSRLRGHLGDAALADLVVVVAFYNMVARIAEPLQVEPDER
jgi:4-carboxymuconolactone decarboxylase